MSGSGNIVWLASYPKSGNTWVRLLLGNLLNLKDDSSPQDEFTPVSGISSARWQFEQVGGLNTYDLTPAEIDSLRPSVYREIANADPAPTFIKVHDAYQLTETGEAMFPADCSRAVIYIVRNPLDVAVSYSHHLGELDLYRTVAMMQDNQRSIGGTNTDQLHQLLGSWSGHYRSWTNQDAIPVLVIRYEDLREDTAAQLKRIAGFAGLSPSSFAMTYADAVEASRFDKLQQIEAQKGFVEKPQNAARFFRSGRSGEGKEKLGADLQSVLIAEHAEVMEKLGYI
ncbi:sulfotransferase domain-containing protein [Erythrobacter sp. MTPC3]|uniref:sulfotransferase domain-containing protein n=1 Tax=Erythrobacter sp. MTPC3 TaxID=3056564 RepID=UPI0036F2ADA3